MVQNLSLNDLVSQLSLGLDAVESELIGATSLHGKRVASLCLAMGRVLGYSDQRLFSLGGCALLHDNALTEYILSERPGREQVLNLKTHCVLGERNCSLLPFPHPADGFILYHHERADGSGPFGLGEGEFPEEAALIALADTVDVRFRLQQVGPEQLPSLHAYLREQEGRAYTYTAVQAALEVLREPLLTQLANHAVSQTLTASLPDLSYSPSDEELLRIAGLVARIIDYKSAYTREHTTQIANKSWLMAQWYGYDRRRQVELYQAAALHDVGKLFIPTDILEKPGPLTGEEYRVIQSHVLHTWELLRPVRGLGPIALWAANHHEKLDGSGYPFGKTGDELDFNSRLLACLDIYQAVRELRPYHPSRSHRQAMDILDDMAKQGLIDAGICYDLDRALGKLRDGNAPFPPLLEQELLFA